MIAHEVFSGRRLMRCLGFALALMVGLLMCESARARITVVQPGPQTFRSAVSAARDFDTLLLDAGVYNCINETIAAPLTIIGKPGAVLDGKEKDEVLVILSNHVALSGLTIRSTNCGSMKDYAGIRVFKSQHVTIENCTLSNTFFGIYLSDSKHVVVKNCRSKGAHFGKSDTGNGIHLWKCDSITIDNNRMEGHRDGIYLEFAKQCMLRNNHCEKNFRYGLHFMFSDNDTYINNTFSNNGTGVAVMYSKGVHMYGNRFVNNWGDAAYGLLLKDMTDAVIRGNIFASNTVGVTMEGSNRMLFEQNNFLRNGYALKIMANCQQDTLQRNNFSGNTFDVATNGTLNNNFFNNNYWDKYEGYDLDKDKIGDVPYQPVSLYSVIVEQMPYAVILLRSFAVDLLDRAEKSIPSLVPDAIKDYAPLMTMVKP